MIRVGDYVACLSNHRGQFTRGKLYKVRYVNDASIGVVADDRGEKNGWGVEHFERANCWSNFVRRRQALAMTQG